MKYCGKTQPHWHETTYTISGNTSSLSTGSILLYWLTCRWPNNNLTLPIFNALHLVHCVYNHHDDGKLHDAPATGSQWPQWWVSWFFSKMACVTSTHERLSLSHCRVSWQMDRICGTHHMPPPQVLKIWNLYILVSGNSWRMWIICIWPMFYIPLWAAVAQHWGVTKVNYNMLQQKWQEINNRVISRVYTEHCGYIWNISSYRISGFMSLHLPSFS